MTQSRLFAATLLCLLFLLSSHPARHAAVADEQTPAGGKGGAAEGAAAEDPAAEDTQQEAEKILEQIHQLNQKEIEGQTRDEQIADYSRNQRAMIKLADKLFQLSQADPEGGLNHAAVAVQVTLRSLQMLQRLGDAQAKADMEAFAKMLSADPRPELAQFGKALVEEIKYQFDVDADPREVARIAAELKKNYGTGDISPESAALILQVLMRVEQAKHFELAKDLNQFFAERFAASPNPQIAAYSERLAGTAVRMDLPGKPIEVSGDFLDGSAIDWESYRGKVVLLDYWATWCGPCIAELPNLLKNYRLYHDRGFEVVGVSVDENREAVEEFLKERELPWQTLFSDAPDQSGWNHPMAKRYGIGGLPTVILIGKDGKVVSLNARGDELGRLLAELIGPPEKSPPAAEKKAG
ncbi:MAG: redoxin family protein [Planctomycetales bacterium]|nr:redoxin family protein [Planctomycetales bacterium]